MASTSITAAKDDSCTLCETKYNRLRPSFCQCKHCSVPMCVDCMKEHHDELMQQATQISHQYNGVKDLLKSKQAMVDETAKQSVIDINQYFDCYIEDLRKTQREILFQIDQVKLDAENYLSKLDNVLTPLSSTIQTLQKADALRPTKFDNIAEKLRELEEQLSVLKVNKAEEFKRVQPTFSLDFNCPIAMPSESVASSKENINQECAQIQQNHGITENSKSKSTVKVSYPMDRMASDGENILYTTYSQSSSTDLICYHQMNKTTGTPDLQRVWNQSRIDDMIWWSAIRKFISATIDSIYTIDQTKNAFKILCVQQKKRPYVRIAANSQKCCIHCNTVDSKGVMLNQIEIYQKDFQLERIIDAARLTYFCTSSSFCVTDHWLASVQVRKKHNRQLMQVNFFNWFLQQTAWLDLGVCTDSIEIRTDGDNLVFIATGKKLLHIVSFNGKTVKKVELMNPCQCLGVLSDGRVACSSKDLHEIELVSF